MKIVDRLINRKTFAFVIIVLLFACMAPVLYCGAFDYANGDDLIGASTAHEAFAKGASVIEYFKVVLKATKENYYHWDGNFASTFIWYAFEPSIFNEYLYRIVPFLAFACIGVNMLYASLHFGRKYLNLSFVPVSIVSICILTYIVQFSPSIKSLLFWWTGIVSYIFPVGLLWLSLVWIDKYCESEKIRYLVFLSLSMIFVGGAGYFTAILALEIFVLFFLWELVKYRREVKKRAGLLVPFMVLVICLIISFIAPGNSARAASEGVEIKLSVSKVVSTIISCVASGGRDMVARFIEIRPLFLLVLLVVLTVWYFLDTKSCRLEFKYPIPVIALMFLLYCSVYAPMIFAGAEVSGGGPNDIFIVFLATLCISLIYFTGFFKKKLIEKRPQSPLLNSEVLKKYVCVPCSILVLIFLLVCGKYLIGNSSGYLCYNFIKSGQLRDFDGQMKERIAILQSEEKDVVLPQMNDEQGPFMHMALTEDASGYTNYVTRKFYFKDSVIAIPRDEWNEKYGGK